MVGVIKPSYHRIIIAGNPRVVERVVETATNMIPGRLAKKGTAAAQVVVSSGSGALLSGWIGYEQTDGLYRPADIDTAHAANDIIAILYGGGFDIQAVLATSQTITVDHVLIAGANGLVTEGAILSVSSGASTTDLTVDGSYPYAGEPIATALENVTTTSAVARLAVRSRI